MREHLTWQGRPAWPLLLLAMAASPLAAATDFERDVAPILLRRCLECHHDGNRSGGLSLASAVGLKAGGENGPVVMAERPDASFLVERVENVEMSPPRQGNARKLSEDEARILLRWIACSGMSRSSRARCRCAPK